MLSKEPAPRRPPIQAVVFDWYATLAAPPADGWWQLLPQLITDGGGVVDEVALAAWQLMPTEHRAQSGTQEAYVAWSLDRFRSLLSVCGVPPSRIDAVVERSEAIRAAESIGLVEGARAVVESLRQAGLLVAVCSNWDWDLDRHLLANGLAGLFDLVVCSAIAGYRKPHRAIFDLVTEGLGVEASSVIFVGDDLEADIVGAHGAGMVPVHAAWALPCGGGHAPSVACCTSYDELLAHPALADRMRRAASADR